MQFITAEIFFAVQKIKDKDKEYGQRLGVGVFPPGKKKNLEFFSSSI